LSGTNATIFDNIKKGKTLQVLLSDSVLRTIIFTPDAGRATALLGNTPDAYNQTWHLPCDNNRLDLKGFIALCSKVYGKELKYTVLKPWLLNIVGLFNPFIKEIIELLYQWEQDYIFDSSKFMKRFPEFRVTPLEEGIEEILREMNV
jgi:nucleoside-diphosphate-sugar epimerase